MPLLLGCLWLDTFPASAGIMRCPGPGLLAMQRTMCRLSIPKQAARSPLHKAQNDERWEPERNIRMHMTTMPQNTHWGMHASRPFGSQKTSFWVLKARHRIGGLGLHLNTPHATVMMMSSRALYWNLSLAALLAEKIVAAR